MSEDFNRGYIQGREDQRQEDKWASIIILILIIAWTIVFLGIGVVLGTLV
jgi:hypothetical protein